MSSGKLETKLTTEEDLTDLSILGKGRTHPSRRLETFPNHHHKRDYTITLTTDEFTCICPATGQPDFATVTITYVPNRVILESKSLKLYLWSYRNEGVFHEHVTNVILDDLVSALDPRSCEVKAEFRIRGGIAITVHAQYHEEDRDP